MKSKNKLLISLFLPALLISLSSCTNKNNGNNPVDDGEDEEEQYDKWITNDDTEFNENKVILSFASFADIHQQTGKDAQKVRFQNAINLAKKYAGGYLDAITVSGDLTNTTDRNETNRETDILQFKDAILNTVDVKETSIIYCLGNHDNDPQYTNLKTMEKIPAMYKEKLGEDFFRNDIDLENTPNGCRHSVVNGIHFLAMTPTDYWGKAGYSAQTKQWFLETLVTLTGEDPNKPIIVLGHEPTYNTISGSSFNTWYRTDIQEIMRNFPQIIYISGHVHNVLQDDRCISQEDYTSMTTGSTYNNLLNLVDDHSLSEFYNNYTADSKSFIKQIKENAQQCILTEIDENYNARVTRLDARIGGEIAEKWYIKSPQDDLSHLKTYNNEIRKQNNAAPVFGEDVDLSITTVGKGVAKLVIPAASDDTRVMYYKVEIYNKKTQEMTHELNISPWPVLYLTKEAMTDSVEYLINDLIDGTSYEINVSAVDCWEARSKPLTVSFNFGS